jgi:hypothetical protein
MGSSNRRTTMAKLNRETRLRERRAEKEARKAARKLTAAHEAEPDPAYDSEGVPGRDDEPDASGEVPTIR